MCKPVSSANFCNSSFQSLTREPLLPPESAVDSVTLPAQFLGQFAHALASPAQRRLWITTAQRLDQVLQIPPQRRVLFGGALASPAGFADSSAGRQRGIA